jgi:hypothetical protein
MLRGRESCTIFTKNTVALVPDSCTRCCSSRTIWEVTCSVVMSEGLVLDRIFFRVFIEEGRDEMMANAMSLSSSGFAIEERAPEHLIYQCVLADVLVATVLRGSSFNVRMI